MAHVTKENLQQATYANKKTRTTKHEHNAMRELYKKRNGLRDLILGLSGGSQQKGWPMPLCPI